MNDSTTLPETPAPSRMHRTAYARYVAILDNPRPTGAETAELATIIADLRLPPEQVAADQATLARFHELSRVCGGKSVAENEHRHRLHQQDDATNRHRDELDEHARSVERARRRVDECDQASAELERMKFQRPELFDDGTFPARLRTAE